MKWLSTLHWFRIFWWGIFPFFIVLAIGLYLLANIPIRICCGRAESDLTRATNVCQLKLQEFKNKPWQELGSENSAHDDKMFQETNLSGFGMTRCQAMSDLSSKGNPCENVQPLSNCENISNQACQKAIESYGPFKYTRSFVICRGDKVDRSSDPASTSSDCEVNPNDNKTRSRWLTCLESDFTNPLGPGNLERKVKILCTWRSSDNGCQSIHVDAIMTKPSE